jgi:hypothetical protein
MPCSARRCTKCITRDRPQPLIDAVEMVTDVFAYPRAHPDQMANAGEGLQAAGSGTENTRLGPLIPPSRATLQ